MLDPLARLVLDRLVGLTNEKIKAQVALDQMDQNAKQAKCSYVY